MRTLVIDTALNLCTVGVFDDERTVAMQSLPMVKGHQERLAGLVHDVVEAAGGGFGALDRIGVTTGPGSFTGLRVGLAFAQGLGTALDRPVVGVSTLDALAASVQGRPPAVAALIDARRGQVYVRFWKDGAPQGPPQALSLDAVAEHLAAMDPATIRVGSGAGLVGHPDAATCLMLAGPDAGALARLALAADPATSPPSPLYLRAPDAAPPTRTPGQPRPARVRTA